MTSRGMLVCLAAWAIAGCDNQPHRTVVITAPPQQQVVVNAPQAPTTIMNSSDLDLATISDLLRTAKITDAETLQATINNPQNAINNVDLDHDGIIDPITVNEGQTAGGKQFNLTANPAGQPATVVANINVNVTGGQAVVQAGYPSYVNGYDRDYYNYSVARDVAFMSWALSPRPMFIAQPYRSYAWYPASSPPHVFAADTVTQRRTEYTTRTHVSPVQRSAPPPSFAQQAQATKVPSGFQPSAAARPTPTTNNLNDRATAQNFRARDTTQPVARATGFGARPSDPAAGSPPPPQRSSFAGSTTPAAASPSPAAAPARPSPPPPAPGPRTSPASSPPSFRPSFNTSSPSGPRTSPKR